MKTVDEVYSQFKSRLIGRYESDESGQIAVLSFEHVMKYGRLDIVRHKNELLSEKAMLEFERILSDLESGKPIQYVLGNAWFYGMNLMVNQDVLIPRKETEELVDWIVNDIKNAGKEPSKIFDICTGSGCIALALKKEFPKIEIFAFDNSEKALEVARTNSEKSGCDIRLIKMDALNMQTEIKPDIVVSNPPYVLMSEKKSMKSWVTDHEPASALFVPDEDALIFYRQIGNWANNSLNSGSIIYFEINERMGNAIYELLSHLGFENIVIKKDLQDKDRMVKAIKS